MAMPLVNGMHWEQYGINAIKTNLVLIVFGKDNYMNYSNGH